MRHKLSRVVDTTSKQKSYAHHTTFV